MNPFVPIATSSRIFKMAIVERVAKEELDITERYLLAARCLVVSAAKPSICLPCRPTVIGNHFKPLPQDGSTLRIKLDISFSIFEARVHVTCRRNARPK